MLLKQKLMIGATALVGMGVGSLGLGVAHASTTTTTNNTPAVHANAPDQAETPGANAESDGPGGHQDANGVDIQYGSQTGPDTTDATNAGTPDAPGGPDVQSGSQTGPDTGAAESSAG